MCTFHLIHFGLLSLSQAPTNLCLGRDILTIFALFNLLFIFPPTWERGKKKKKHIAKKFALVSHPHRDQVEEIDPKTLDIIIFFSGLFLCDFNCNFNDYTRGSMTVENFLVRSKLKQFLGWWPRLWPTTSVGFWRLEDVDRVLEFGKYQ